MSSKNDQSSELTSKKDSGLVKASSKNASEPKKKIPRPSKKSPSKPKDTFFDFDKHCGVTGADGIPCSRVITCKAHTLAMKRAVAGRSKSFQELLTAHQANNSRTKVVLARPKKAESSVATEPKSRSKTAATKIHPEMIATKDDVIEDSSDFDSDAELDLILNAIRYHASRPIISYEAPSLKRKYDMLRCQLLLNPLYSEDSAEKLPITDIFSDSEVPFNVSTGQE